MAEGDDRSSRLPAILRGEARHPSVQAMERRADGKPGWTLTLQEGEKSEREDFDFVSFATGPLSEKRMCQPTPASPGFSRRAGRSCSRWPSRILPSPRESTWPSWATRNRPRTWPSTPPITAGSPALSSKYRQNVSRIPRLVGGINFKHLLYMRA